MDDIAIAGICIDCSEVRGLARFWCDALGYEAKHVEEGHALLRHPRGERPELFLQRVPEPKLVKNRVHLDLCARDEEAQAARLEDLGARRLRRCRGDGVWIVMADPEGNEFCVCRA